MIAMKILLVSIIVATAVADIQNIIEYEMEKLMEKETQGGNRPVTIQNFQWKDCGGPSSLATIKSLSINDPVQVPGTLTISLSVDVKAVLDQLKADLTIFKKIEGSYIKIPCIAGFGSCHYNDVCSMLGQIPQCPDPLLQIGIDCKCPVKPKPYVLTNAQFDIGAAILFGDFHFIGNLTTKAGKTAGCLDFYLSFQ